MGPIFDGSDLKGISHPMDIKYMRYVRFWLRLIGCWPGRALGEQTTVAAVLFTYFNFFLAALCWCLMVAFVRNHINVWSFFEMGKVYINTFMCTVYTTRQFIPLTASYGRLIGQFIKEVHLFHHQHHSEYAKKMYLYVHKVSYMFTIFSVSIMLWGYVLYYSIPLYNNWVGGGYSGRMPANFSYEYAIDYEVPFDYSRSLSVHIMLFFFTMYSGFGCCVCFCMNDLLLSLQMFHLWGNLKILIHNLENFLQPVRSEDICYTKKELPDVSRRLRDIVVHHNLILRNMEDISSTFGFSIAVYYLYHQLANCVMFLQLSSLDPKALIRYGPMTLIILQLQIQISAVFELLSSMTDKLILAAYSLPWELMDVRNRRAAHLILAQSQRPLGLKAVGMVEVGIQTTVTILKTTLSYFVMLRAVAME